MQRASIASWCLIALMLSVVGSALAEERTVQNDSWVPGQTNVVGGFVAGEKAAAWLTSPCAGSIVAVQILWLSRDPSPDSIEREISINLGGTFPTPGTVHTTLEGPVMVAGFINEFRFQDDNQTIPINVPVTAGQQFQVIFTFDTAPDVIGGGPSIVRDNDGCQPQRNGLFAIPGGWFSSCQLGLQGDWVIRAVIDCGSAQPTFVTFAEPEVTVDEGDGVVALSLELNQPMPAAGGSVGYSFFGGSATIPEDLTLLGNGTVTFAGGSNGGFIGVSLNDDLLNELDEVFQVQLNAPNNLTIGSPGIITVNLSDNDAGPAVPTNPSPADDATGVLRDVTMNWDDSAGATSYDIYLWESPGARPGTPTATGLGTSEYTPPANLDYETEYLWQVVARDALTQSEGPRWSFETELEPLVLRASFTATTSSLNEDVGIGTIEVALSQPAPLNGCSVQYGITAGGTATGGAGNDLTLVGNGTLTFTNGQTSRLIGVAVNDDILDEIDETAIIRLSLPINCELGTNDTHTVTITDNDTGPVPPALPVPVDAGTDVAPDASFDWADSSGATGYDFYLWTFGGPRPAVPTGSNLATSEFNPAVDMLENSQYAWQVVARGATANTEGPVWTFTTGELSGPTVDSSGVTAY